MRAIVLAIAATACACGPHVDDEDDGAPPPTAAGELVFQDVSNRLYRLDGRVEVIYDYERDDGITGRCGFLSDRAQSDLQETLAGLDPTVDYGEHSTDCLTYDALVYVDDFQLSPFECAFGCCHPDLSRVMFVYTMILSNFEGVYPTVGDEEYVAVEPDQPCP